MQKTPVKGTHTRPRGLWPHRPRTEPCTNGELTENRVRLNQLIATAQEKTLQVAAVMKEKISEQTKLKKDLDAAFKKTTGIAHQKALARTRTELENHLHHTMRELDLKKAELKTIYHELNGIKERLRKNN
ncbi:MAG: hypothetical protein Q7R35_08225 [Elusimicrobiota bacterium]|nr:hypothetical protein [Elusimicrobiota bacterium]